MRRSARRAFSLLEVLAAVIILGVVAAATVATVAPTQSKVEGQRDVQDLARLNTLSQRYHKELGRHPENIESLIAEGYLKEAPDARLPRLREFSYDAATGIFGEPDR